MKVRYYQVIFGSVLVLLMIAGCSSGPASTSTPSTPLSSPAGSTFGANAQDGQTTFAKFCTRCHGASGQGITAPAIIGSNANLAKYGTAKGLLDSISTSMPLNAPGSLSHQEYINLLCYLLVQNNDVQPPTPFAESGLSQLQVK
jgi:cytochrome c